MDMNATTAATTTAPSVVTASRPVERLVQGQATSDGAGVKLVRVLTQDLQRRLDPFLMLDAFGTENPGDYIGGFPDHPHRGFETITYMLEGRMRHRDSAGNEGLLVPGSVQWMTAGRGVIHSEMPEQQEGAMEGFQLWLNLPGKTKMQPPWYRDIASSEIPEWHAEGVTVRVIAGATHGVAGAVQRADTEPLYLDVHLAPGARFEQPLPTTHNAFAYVYRGSLAVAGTAVRRGRMAIFANPRPDFSVGATAGAGPDGVLLEAGDEGAKAILIAGRPLREPIAQHGPFVMNTQQELYQAVEDFRAGRLA
ncbi:MAG: pirin family protein [Rubrivivax sp.]|nr:pirin family protein [Rubrivivax sp.]